jgi:uncharacterized protein YecE (DUF72 family)
METSRAIVFEESDRVGHGSVSYGTGNGVPTALSARVGCSGWQYKHWRGAFYPVDLPASQWFAYYASQFDTVEINNTFYRLPEASTFAAWRKRATPGFLYAVKASRFLTHMKKLKDPAEPIHRLFQRAQRLQRTLGPVLYQLPPHWPANIERLSAFVRALPKRRQHVIEFREPSWYNDEVFELLERKGIALCLHDMAGSRTGKMMVGPFVYVRFHGPAKYTGSYDDRVLNDWAEWLTAQMRHGRQIFAYFNNDAVGHAPRDAIRLRRAIALTYSAPKRAGSSADRGRDFSGPA